MSEATCDLSVYDFSSRVIASLGNGLMLYATVNNNHDCEFRAFPDKFGLSFVLQTLLQDTDRIWQIIISETLKPRMDTRGCLWSIQSPRAYSLAIWSIGSKHCLVCGKDYLINIRGNFDQQMTPSRIAFWEKWCHSKSHMRISMMMRRIWMVLPL